MKCYEPALVICDTVVIEAPPTFSKVPAMATTVPSEWMLPSACSDESAVAEVKGERFCDKNRASEVVDCVAMYTDDRARILWQTCDALDDCTSGSYTHTSRATNCTAGPFSNNRLACTSRRGTDPKRTESDTT